MSLPRASTLPVPERPAEIAHAACPQGKRSMQRRETIGPGYPDTHCADLYPPVEHTAEAPWRLAEVRLLGPRQEV
jgi:hypothetical protein